MYLKKIWEIFDTDQKKKLLFIFFLMIFSTLAEILSIGMILPILHLLTNENTIDKINEFISLDITNFTSEKLFFYLIALLVITYFLKGLILIYMLWKQNKFSSLINAEISQKLFKGYMKKSYSFHTNTNSSTLIRNVNQETEIFTAYILHASLNLLIEILVLFGTSCLLLFIEPLASSIVIIIILISSYVFISVTKGSVKIWGENRQYHLGKKIQHLQQGFDGIKEIKIMNKEDSFLKYFELHNFKTAKLSYYYQTLTQSPRVGLELIAVLSLAIVIMIISLQQNNINNLLPIIGLFGAAALRLMPSVNRILLSVQQLRYGYPSINIIHQELKNKSKFEENIKNKNSQLKIFKDDFKKLKLKNITFRYHKSKTNILENLNLEINRGDMIGIVGQSGAGKSTLVDIISGLLPLEKGEVEVDENNINLAIREWQNKIGYVPQSIYLIDDSLKNNIIFGTEDKSVNLNELNKSIEYSQLKSFINGLPDKIETHVGEKGVKLSGGQRQRIGIARVLYHNPEIIILDEATSALDLNTEKEFLNSLNLIKKYKTIIIISHRQSSMQLCDKVYKLDNKNLEKIN